MGWWVNAGWKFQFSRFFLAGWQVGLIGLTRYDIPM